MKRFTYRLIFSPFGNSLLVKNKADFWKRVKKLWPEYDVKKIVYSVF